MKISVVIATYNGEKYLHKQIESLLAQTKKPDEIIVTDDCSTDNTVSILNAYQLQGKLTYLINPVRLGVAENFIKAVSLTKTGNFIAFCDQDDEWMPEKLEKTSSLLNSFNDDTIPCMVYSDLMFVDESGNILSESFRDMLGHNSYVHNLQTLLYTNFVNGCTVLMNGKAKQEFIKMPGDVRSHDEWLALIVFALGKAAYLKQPLVKYKKHASNFSIAADFKLMNRFYSNLKDLYNMFSGKDLFLVEQISAIEKFYELNAARIAEDKKILFKKFIALKEKSFISKKLNYRAIIRQNKPVS